MLLKLMTTLNALAEPNRLKMVELLRTGPLTVGEITERLGLHQPQTSKHLKVLSEARIVEVEVSANRQIYKLLIEPFEEMEHWLKSYLDVWEERFDNLDEYLQKLQAEERKQDKT